MDFKSYTREEISAALAAGESVWALDTGNSGEDDHLIGTKEEVLRTILHHMEFDELPADWSLDAVDWEI